jgi:hypothetical protein
MQIAAQGDAPLGNGTTVNNQHTERYVTLVNLDRADPPAASAEPGSSSGGSSSTTPAPNP